MKLTFAILLSSALATLAGSAGLAQNIVGVTEDDRTLLIADEQTRKTSGFSVECEVRADVGPLIVINFEPRQADAKLLGSVSGIEDPYTSFMHYLTKGSSGEKFSYLVTISLSGPQGEFVFHGEDKFSSHFGEDGRLSRFTVDLSEISVDAGMASQGGRVSPNRVRASLIPFMGALVRSALVEVKVIAPEQNRVALQKSLEINQGEETLREGIRSLDLFVKACTAVREDAAGAGAFALIR